MLGVDNAKSLLQRWRGGNQKRGNMAGNMVKGGKDLAVFDMRDGSGAGRIKTGQEPHKHGYWSGRINREFSGRRGTLAGQGPSESGPENCRIERKSVRKRVDFCSSEQSLRIECTREWNAITAVSSECSALSRIPDSLHRWQLNPACRGLCGVGNPANHRKASSFQRRIGRVWFHD